jgi:hypothetical protein
LEIVRAADFGAAANLRISAIFGQPGNVMKCLFYDIIAETIATQRFPALALLALARKCHETCGCVTFCEISGGRRFSFGFHTHSGGSLHLCALAVSSYVNIGV